MWGIFLAHSVIRIRKSQSKFLFQLMTEKDLDDLTLIGQTIDKRENKKYRVTYLMSLYK